MWISKLIFLNVVSLLILAVLYTDMIGSWRVVLSDSGFDAAVHVLIVYFVVFSLAKLGVELIQYWKYRKMM